jgi:hypothetical protein
MLKKQPGEYTAEEIAELEEAARAYYALEAYGVDNWDGYGEAMRSLEDED